MDKLRFPTALAAVLLTAILTAGCAHAAGEYGWLGLDALTDALPEAARDVLEAEDGADPVPASLGRVLSETLGGAVRSAFRAGLATSAAVLAASVLCGVAGELTPDRGKGIDYVNLAGTAAIAVSAAGGFTTLMGEAASAVGELTDLGTMLLPVMASVSAATGAVSSGAAKYAASALFLNVLGTLSKKLVIPLIYMYLAASLGQAAFGGGAGGVAKLIAGLVKRALVITALAFSVYLGAVSLIASSADAAAVKLTRTAISTLLPVVGGMVADASDTLLSGMGVIRGALGAAGLVAVAAVCLGPVARLLINAALLRCAAALAGTVAPRPVSDFIASVAEGYSLMLALTGAEAAMLAIAVISAAKTAGG